MKFSATLHLGGGWGGGVTPIYNNLFFWQNDFISRGKEKIEGRNPFWKLLELIAESNDYENVNNAQVDEIPDVGGRSWQR